MVMILVDRDPTEDSDACPFSYLNEDYKWQYGLPWAKYNEELCCCETHTKCPYLKVKES